MDKNYIKFIIAYDYCAELESMDLACDEAYDLAEEIANRYIQYTEENNIDIYYDSLNEYCNNISFYKIWGEMGRI